MKKSYPLFANALLFLWFLLDMTGFHVGNNVLVARAWQDDEIFLPLFLGFLVVFICREGIGKYLLTVWLLI